MKELDEICKYDLSMTTLRENVSNMSADDIDPNYYDRYPFLISMCMNVDVTLEMVEYIIKLFPEIVAWGSWGAESALHCACSNDSCPDSVIELLVKEFPEATRELSSILESGIYYDNGRSIGMGLPIHYYLMRDKVDVRIVKLLVEANPQSLVTADQDCPVYPIHACVYERSNLGAQETLKYLLEQDPSSIRMVDVNGKTPLNLACAYSYLRFKMFELLFIAWPDAIRVRDNMGSLAIHNLCLSKGSRGKSILRFMLSIDPTLAREVIAGGYLPIHCTRGKRLSFCKILIDAYPESLKVEASDGSLPLHAACKYGDRYTVDTIQYMLELHPESINARDREGRLPIHSVVQGEYLDVFDKKATIVALLLGHDPDAASKRDSRGRLPLHMALKCSRWRPVVRFPESILDVLIALFDTYPEAIYECYSKWNTALKFARDHKMQSIKIFLQAQHHYAMKARDMTSLTTLDENGWLLLNHALKDNNVSVGTIKLLVRNNPAAVRTADNMLAFPLHLACQCSSVQVVQYLLGESNEHIIVHLDANKNSIFHYACRGGNFGVIKTLLKSHPSLAASSKVNIKNELPIHLLCEAGKDTAGSEIPEYVDDSDESCNSHCSDSTDDSSDSRDSSKCGESSSKSGEKNESPEHVEAIWLLLSSNPEAILMG